ncbi:MAG: nucleotidyltransferase family protein [Acutalibacteraceae bacterium]|nr:nucleotidyltransferase family protein [Acutalibacteraceae bacterium]
MNKNILSHFNEYCCVFRLVNSAVNNITVDISDLEIDWKYVFTLSDYLGFTALVKRGIDLLCDEQMPSAELKKIFDREFKRQLIIDSNQLYELELMINAFEKAGINILLLKGTYIKNLYPSTVYRYMGDIDTYIECIDSDNANIVLTNLGYKIHDSSADEKIYIKEPFICLEEHFTLSDSGFKVINDYYKTILKKCTLKKDYSHIYEMTIEDIYIYLSVHAVHHYYYAGIAPRIFLDYYVFLEKYKDSLNMDYVESVLKSFGYYEFNKKAVKLAYKWFGKNGTGLDKNSDIDLFIASCSTYGTDEHNVGIRATKMITEGETPSKIKFLMKQLFPSYSKMEEKFPILKKSPLILPIVWIRYVASKMINQRTAKYYKNINSDTADFYQKIESELGLNSRKD